MGSFSRSMRDLLVAACGLLVVACMWDLAPRPGIEPGPPALGVQSPTHWTTREVPGISILNRVPREGSTEKVTSLQRPKGEKGESHVFNLSEECFRLRVASAKALGQEHTWYI